MNLSVENTVEKLLPAGAIYFSMDEQDVRRILRFEHTMIGSDGCRTTPRRTRGCGERFREY